MATQSSNNCGVIGRTLDSSVEVKQLPNNCYKSFIPAQFNNCIPIRTIMRDNNPWFVAADVCRALDVGETHVAIRRLDDDEKGRFSVPTPGGNQEMTIINEPGLYSLILGSRKPEAKAFKRWIAFAELIINSQTVI